MIRAITLDLDDTLWPVWPAIERAEQVLHAWLAEHAPATAARFDTAGLRALREQVGSTHPERAHALSWLREHSIGLALTEAGDDPALAAPAFALFFAQRQRVSLYPEVPAALAALSARWPLLALTKGNADLGLIGLAPCFVGSLTAREFGRGKPDTAFFHAACERLGLPPAAVLHVGDDWALDIEGACAAGQPAAWVRRPGHRDKPAGSRVSAWGEFSDLDQLLAALA